MIEICNSCRFGSASLGVGGHVWGGPVAADGIIRPTPHDSKLETQSVTGQSPQTTDRRELASKRQGSRAMKRVEKQWKVIISCYGIR